MEGNTIMNGLDDYPRKTEVTYPADAQQLLAFAQSKGINTLSMWEIQRDNGGCPGARGKNNCSGIVQGTWDFSHILEVYTGEGRTGCEGGGGAGGAGVCGGGVVGGCVGGG